jgi:hypothetical protein
MRRFYAFAFLGLAALASTAGSDVLVTVDGTVVETKGPWEQRGAMVIFTLENGQLSALRAEDVDFEATERWSAAVAEAEAPAPEEPPAAPKAKIVITDADVSHAEPPLELEDDPATADGAAAADAEGTGGAAPPLQGPVRVTAWDEEEPADGRGRRIFGTLRNDSNSFATGISVEVSVFDEEGIIAGRETAVPALTSLRPGESTTFSVQFADVYVVGATQMQVTSLDLEIGAGEAGGDAVPPEEI